MEEWRKERILQKQKARRDPSLQDIDASFMTDIDKLAVALANLVEREGHKAYGSHPITAHITMILRHVTATFALLRFVNNDETRDFSGTYRLAYSFVVLPLVRTMIDGLYNITAMLDDPARAFLFQKSGYKRVLAALHSDEERYGSDPKWKRWIQEHRQQAIEECRLSGVTAADLSDKESWPLLGTYLRANPTDTPHKNFLRRFTKGFWYEYSEISHATFRGLKEGAAYLLQDRAPHEKREDIQNRAELDMSNHMGRAAGLLLSLLTEIQAKFKFEGHNINKRLHKAWRDVQPFFEIKELYDNRYKLLMEQSNITDAP